ncbi:type VI secretion system Vgr family protein [Citrobacter sp. RHBSTW-00671]|uniref:type VI secretion system Vgr family protein n=1 Tax=Citrobacter sp. RHBSTW-00671 TaxID=2742660 RepID=UPI0017F3C96D|nr:type VI secretion system tip protein TssI/VgrG [Citrobacter sp. RHBSTW-00671]MBA7966556.1 type VI secretion system tip protein VgrG [Citrobacter sp. RHBSTW-00671]HCJ6373898.1 type VI secretion system tip protein VgrG [Citrobacter freundii]
MMTHAESVAIFSSTALEATTLLVEKWKGEEEISKPYRFEIDLACEDMTFDAQTLLGKPATISLVNANGEMEPYHGVVTSVVELNADSHYSYFQVVLEPRLALLKQFRFSDTWLDLSLPDIIRVVIAELGNMTEGAGVQSKESMDKYDFDIRIPSEDIGYTQEYFTCQFEETSLRFLARKLEYYGIYYYFEQQRDHEAVIFCGDIRFQPEHESVTINYRPQSRTLAAEIDQAMLSSFTRHAQIVPDKLVLKDFSTSNAQLQLTVEDTVDMMPNKTSSRKDGSEGHAFIGEQVTYDEHYGSLAEGDWLIKRRSQALRCIQSVYQGSGRATGVRAGYFMRLNGHSNQRLNTRFQVIKVKHTGQQPLPALEKEGVASIQEESRTQFVALSEDLQFRPMRTTAKPRIIGTLNAVIDNDNEDDVPLLNEHGCYKVRFPFARKDRAQTRGSAWVRMATPSNGSKHGMHFPLIKGTEVLISFMGGDPDRPVIIGSVPNSENPSIVNADNATTSGFTTVNGHYLKADDNPSTANISMGTPSGDSHFSLGHAGVSGASLTTQNHMKFGSNSFEQNIGDHFTVSVTGADAPVESVKGEAKDTDKHLHWANNHSTGTKANNVTYKKFVANSVSFSGDVNSAGIKFVNNANGINTTLNENGAALTVNANITSVTLNATGATFKAECSGPSYTLNKVLHKRLATNHVSLIKKKTVVYDKEDKVVSKSLLYIADTYHIYFAPELSGTVNVANIADIKADANPIFTIHNTGKVELQSPVEIILSCGNSSITLKDGEICLKSGDSVYRVKPTAINTDSSSVKITAGGQTLQVDSTGINANDVSISK